MNVKPLPGVDPLSVWCPFCAAPKDRMCRLHASCWDAPKPHAARIRLANAQSEQEPKP
jgi:hypothetical protein